MVTKAAALAEFMNGLPYRHLERISNDNQIISESKIALLETCLDNVSRDNTAEQARPPVEVELAFQDIYRVSYSNECSCY